MQVKMMRMMAPAAATNRRELKPKGRSNTLRISSETPGDLEFIYATAKYKELVTTKM